MTRTGEYGDEGSSATSGLINESMKGAAARTSLLRKRRVGVPACRAASFQAAVRPRCDCLSSLISADAWGAGDEGRPARNCSICAAESSWLPSSTMRMQRGCGSWRRIDSTQAIVRSLRPCCGMMRVVGGGPGALRGEAEDPVALAETEGCGGEDADSDGVGVVPEEGYEADDSEVVGAVMPPCEMRPVRFGAIGDFKLGEERELALFFCAEGEASLRVEVS